MRFVKARARAIVEDAMVRTCQSKLEKMEKYRLPRMSLRSWDPAMLRSPGFARGESLGCYLEVTRAALMTILLFDREGEPEYGMLLLGGGVRDRSEVLNECA